MNNQSILSIVNGINYSAEGMYGSVVERGFEATVEYNTPLLLLLALQESDNPYVQSKNLAQLADTLFLLHKGFFMAKAAEAFKKEYK